MINHGNHLSEEERNGCLTLIVFLRLFMCLLISLHHDVMGWSVIYLCFNIFWSYAHMLNVVIFCVFLVFFFFVLLFLCSCVRARQNFEKKKI